MSERVRLYEGIVRVGHWDLCFLLAVVAQPSCRERHPWDATGDASDNALGTSPIVAAPSLPDSDGRGGADAGATPDAGEPEGVALPAARVGGPWVRCYGNFRLTGEPLKDMTRLALLCGPENGMSRLSTRPFEGSVKEGGPPMTQTLPVHRGTCYRIFAAATPSIADLDVVVKSSRGATVAADHGEDGWPIVQPDRPFCALEDDTFTVEVGAHRGEGRFAAETWQLRPAPQLAPEEAARRHAAEKP